MSVTPIATEQPTPLRLLCDSLRASARTLAEKAAVATASVVHTTQLGVDTLVSTLLSKHPRSPVVSPDAAPELEPPSKRPRLSPVSRPSALPPISAPPTPSLALSSPAAHPFAAPFPVANPFAAPPPHLPCRTSRPRLSSFLYTPPTSYPRLPPTPTPRSYRRSVPTRPLLPLPPQPSILKRPHRSHKPSAPVLLPRPMRPSIPAVPSAPAVARPPTLEQYKARREEVLRNEHLTHLRLHRSRKRSSDLHRELFIQEQQRELKLRQRQIAIRNLAALQASHQPPLDKPDPSATHWNDVFYEDVDGTAQAWIEHADPQAMEERRLQVTVSTPPQAQEASAFAPLTPTAMKRLRATLSDHSVKTKKLNKIDGCVICGDDLYKLKPKHWLNDEVINAYLTLLSKRSEQTRQRLSNKSPPPANLPPKTKVMNSFFYSKLVQTCRITGRSEYDYSRVKRWTRRFDPFSFDIMLIPINSENLHWSLCVVNFREKTVQHFDSMGGGGWSEVAENIMNWVVDEGTAKGKEQDWNAWKASDPAVPKQANTDDCGVFLCKFADFVARGWKQFTFDQSHMLYFRARIAHELLMGKAT